MGADRRGLSEGLALGVLVGMVVLSTGAVGLYVLVTDPGEESVSANFTFQYFDDSGAVLITHSQGESLAAGNIELEGPDNTITWAEAANEAENASVSVGDAVQLSRGNVYGSSIVTGDTIRVYRAEAGNRTEITSWRAGS